MTMNLIDITYIHVYFLFPRIYNLPLNIEPQKVYDEPRPTGRCRSSSSFVDDHLHHEDQSRDYWNSDVKLYIIQIMLWYDRHQHCSKIIS